MPPVMHCRFATSRMCALSVQDAPPCLPLDANGARTTWHLPAASALSPSDPTLRYLVLRQAKETDKPHSGKASKPASGAAKPVPSSAKDADRDTATKADGKAAALKHGAEARPHKGPAAAKKDSATAAKANAKEEKANGRVVVKKERKVFELPGQTRDTPPEVYSLTLACSSLDFRSLRPTQF